MGVVEPSQNTSDSSEVLAVVSTLCVTKTNLMSNVSSNSLAKANEMLKYGNTYVHLGPTEHAGGVTWTVTSQTNSNLYYSVIILPNVLIMHKSTQEKYKNFNFNCTCPDFKVIVSLS